MAIRGYLKSGIENLPGYEKTSIRDRNGNQYHTTKVCGYPVKKEGYRCYIEIEEDTRKMSDLHPAIIPLLEELTIFSSLMGTGAQHRENGMYRYKSAELELNQTSYFCRANTLEDLHVLIFKIKAGEIRPEISYEVEQGGKSFSEVKADLELALEIGEEGRLEQLAMADREIECLQKENDELKNALRAATEKKGLKHMLATAQKNTIFFLATTLEKTIFFLSYPFRAMRKKLGR